MLYRRNIFMFGLIANARTECYTQKWKWKRHTHKERERETEREKVRKRINVRKKTRNRNGTHWSESLREGFFTIKTEFITCLFFIANNLYGQKFSRFACTLFITARTHTHTYTSICVKMLNAEGGRVIFLLLFFCCFLCFQNVKYIFTH